MKILKGIFWFLLCVGLFIWAGCNMDLASSSEKYIMDTHKNVIIVDKHFDWDLLSDDWYISVEYDDKVSVIEVTKETYMSYQIGDRVYMDILTGKRI